MTALSRQRTRLGRLLGVATIGGALAAAPAGCNQVLGLDGVPIECSADEECGPKDECQTNTCESGLCKRVDAGAGTACAEHPDGLCNGSGVCNPPSCSDRVQNQDETDIDCGGPCGPCPTGRACASDPDCESGFCPAADGVCCDATCDGECLSCATSKTGAPDGTCTAIAANTDPDGECLGDDLACEVAGCNGDATAAGCNRMAVGEICRPDADPNEGGCDKAEVCGAEGPCPEDAGPNLVCEYDLNEKSSTCAADCGAQLVAAGEQTSCAVLVDGSARCWGYSTALGNGQNGGANALEPVIVTGLAGAKQLAGGGETFCAIDPSGDVLCWGRNDYGAAGSGPNGAATTPRSVSLPAPAVSVAAGAVHACASLEDGSVWCWGLNALGQLGVGTADTCDGSFGGGLPCSRAPVKVPGIGTATGVATGTFHTCAVLADRTVTCWGNNDQGQLGCGGPQLPPTKVSGLDNIVQVVASWESTCALDASGDVRCLGGDSVGQLGNGEPRVDSCTPQPVALSAAARSLTGASSFVPDQLNESYCALTTSGTVQCWGQGDWGQLGNGFGPRASPVEVATVDVSGGVSSPPRPLTGVTGLGCGGRACFAILDDGSVRGWGANEQGQLGVIFAGVAQPVATLLEFL